MLIPSISSEIQSLPVLPSYQWKHNENSERLLLRTMMVSRFSDERESILYRQGRGQFHLPSAGHETLAVLGTLINSSHDWLYCYYRDKALLLGMGVPLYNIALDFFAKAESSSAGRQMSSHFSDASRNVVSYASPTGLQFLPAVGTAWGVSLKNQPGVVYCCTGEAATRQGEFYEAVSFAIQKSLAIIFLVEDNGYGVSTPTHDLTPVSLGAFPEIIQEVDARDPASLLKKVQEAKRWVQRGNGPRILWLHLDRMMSHTSSDDQSLYRSSKELLDMQSKDPIGKLKRQLLSAGNLSPEELDQMIEEIREEIKYTYKKAEQAADPLPESVTKHIFSNMPSKKHFAASLTSHGRHNMAQAFNETLCRLLDEKPNVVVFGEDVEDPKGGVFGLTKGLSSKFPKQVFNAPLAEATIAGTATGLALSGHVPIFELQFIDFVGPAFNQIVNQIATLRWRTAGNYQCPLVLYAPCGAYISGGGPWHSQTNEGWFAHVPGLKVYMPSTAHDAAEMLYTAAHGKDPVLLLLPKNLFRKPLKQQVIKTFNIEQAAVTAEGRDITIVTWGNCTDLAQQANEELLKKGIQVEIIDLRSLVPCDWTTLHHSVRKTSRLLVVQEDNRSCSFGQAIISTLLSNSQTWQSLQVAPVLLSREDVHVGFHKNLASAVVPHSIDIVNAVQTMMERNDVS